MRADGGGSRGRRRASCGRGRSVGSWRSAVAALVARPWGPGVGASADVCVCVCVGCGFEGGGEVGRVCVALSYLGPHSRYTTLVSRSGTKDVQILKAGYPGGRRSCPIVAQQLSRTCPRSREPTKTRPKLVDLGQFWLIRAAFDTRDGFRQELAEFGQMMADVGQVRPAFGQHRPSWCVVSSNLARVC